MRLQKEGGACVHRQPEKFFHVVVELNNVPGALCNVLRDLGDFGISVLDGSSSVDIYSRTAVWSAFVRDSDRTVSQLKGKISSSQNVLDSMVVESESGFFSGGTRFSLSSNAEGMTLMGRGIHPERILRKLRERFGAEGERILYDEGHACGKEVGVDYTRRLGVGFARANLLDVFEMYETARWFRLEGVERFKRYGVVTVRTRESFECEGARSSRPYSQFLRGHLSGGLTAILGKEMACEETKCVAAGDENCEFVLSSRSGIYHVAELNNTTA